MDTTKKEATKETIITALIEAKGIVSTACSACGLARSTFYLWYNSDNDFKIAVDDVQEVSIDFVEGKLFNLIEKGDTAATLFYLKTKGKKRGYIESADNTPPAIVINTTVTKEEAIDIYKTLQAQC